MAGTITQVDRWHDSKRVHYIGTVVFTGNYATGGEAFNLASTLNIPSPPSQVVVMGQAGYVYQWDRTNNKIMVRQAAAAGNPLAEIAAAAYPAGVLADVVRLYAIGKLTA